MQTTVTTNASSDLATFVRAYPGLFTSKEDYQTFVRRWKELAHAKKLTKEDCLLRCVLLGKDIDKAFPVTKNEVRIQNGALSNTGLKLARGTVVCADPVTDYARDVQREEDAAKRRIARGLPPLAPLTRARRWAETWVTPGYPESTGRGLSCAVLVAAAAKLRTL